MSHRPAMTLTTIRAALQWASHQLQAVSESPRLDAELLLMHTLGINRTTLYQSLGDPLPALAAEQFATLVARRQHREPVAYITGHKEFFGLDFLVSPSVLIPRPETELLVQWTLDWLTKHPGASCVDVGTGSGAIILAIAWNLPKYWQGLLVGNDISIDALQVARANRQRLGLTHVRLVGGSLLEWCRGKFDVIVANLPYLREDQAHAGLTYEPPLALYAGQNGFALYEALLMQAPHHLRTGGMFLCEIDPSQANLAQLVAARAFPKASIRILPDLTGTNRYLRVDVWS